MTENLIHDVLILEAGLAGLRGAVEISRRTEGRVNIGIVSKVQLMRAHSVCAEGGTAAMLRPDEGDSFELPDCAGHRHRQRWSRSPKVSNGGPRFPRRQSRPSEGKSSEVLNLVRLENPDTREVFEARRGILNPESGASHRLEASLGVNIDRYPCGYRHRGHAGVFRKVSDS